MCAYIQTYFNKYIPHPNVILGKSRWFIFLQKLKNEFILSRVLFFNIMRVSKLFTSIRLLQRGLNYDRVNTRFCCNLNKPEQVDECSGDRNVDSSKVKYIYKNTFERFLLFII